MSVELRREVDRLRRVADYLIGRIDQSQNIIDSYGDLVRPKDYLPISIYREYEHTVFARQCPVCLAYWKIYQDPYHTLDECLLEEIGESK